MLAIMSQASALAMVASKSLARRRLRPSQAKVRSSHPTPGQDLEARHVVASLDDLQRPLADLFQHKSEATVASIFNRNPNALTLDLPNVGTLRLLVALFVAAGVGVTATGGCRLDIDRDRRTSGSGKG